jgi:glycosyltransferase involved in cell wall biosynthesis
MRAPPRILYVVSEDWYFLLHRLPMARAAHAAGFEVHVATNVTKDGAAIVAEGFVLHAIPFVRGRIAPLAAMHTVAALRRIHRAIAPAIVHHITLQAGLLGVVPAWCSHAARITTFTGFGYAFISRSARARLVRSVFGPAIRLLLLGRRSVATVENPDDCATLVALGVPADRIVLIPGSGVDVARLVPMPPPAGPPTVGFAGRLLADKGIRTLVAAHRLLRDRGSNVSLLIAGIPDPANPASVTRAEAEAWSGEPGVTWLGHVADIATLWARAHIAVLPSRREGLPMALVEAAACGRPLIATDVPGCREVAIPDRTGLLVPPGDPSALAAAIEKLAASPGLCERFGVNGRALAVERFSADAIGRPIVDLYRRMSEGAAPADDATAGARR